MSHDPREPLSPDEAALARVYAALPRPEPSPALDAKILAQAREAIAPTVARRRRRPWYLMPGTGVAAAAVLAAGLAWQVGLMDEGAMQGVSTMPAPAAPASAPADNNAPVAVEFMRREQVAPAADAEIAAEPETEQRKAAPPPAPRAAAAPRERAARAAPQAFPQQAPAPVVAEEAPAPAAAPAPEPSSALGGATADRIEIDRDTYADEDKASLDTITVTGSRIKRVDTDLPPWQQDGSLPPDQWLERVRDRIRAGDREAARFSLRRFTRAHPSVPVPDDLTLLLVQ